MKKIKIIDIRPVKGEQIIASQLSTKELRGIIGGIYGECPKGVGPVIVC
jgi:bacteriocin-like protein